jgi:hypothetical protein
MRNLKVFNASGKYKMSGLIPAFFICRLDTENVSTYLITSSKIHFKKL